MKLLFRTITAAVIMGSAVLTGCNINSNSEPDPAAVPQLSGTAAVGAPVEGIVYVKDSQGVEVNAATDAAGKFTVSLEGMQPGFMIKFVPTGGGATMYSFAPNAGIANATPLTNFALFLASNKADLETIYNTWDGTGVDETGLRTAQATINLNLASNMESAGLDPSSYDFVNEPFDADSSGIDGVLDGLNVVVDLQMGTYTFQVVDNGGFVFDENINAAGVYIGEQIDWPNGGEAAYPVVANMVIQGASATYTVLDNNPYFFGAPFGTDPAVLLYITMDESGVLTLWAGSNSLVLTDPVIYKQQPNRIIWKDSASGSWVVGIVTPTANGPLILSFDVTSAAHHDQDGFVTQGIIQFDIPLL